MRKVKLKLVETSDIHGAFTSYDFRSGGVQSTGLSHISAYLTDERAKYGKNLVLLDNGDILQGQPSVYYFNYIDTLSPIHKVADMMNYLGYDAGNMGNHDVETGHGVYDRWIKQCKFPILGANIIDNHTQKPYCKPYTIIEREGVKIAVLGMITPVIPHWLPETLWHNLRFESMEDTARKWVAYINENEHPDLLVGLFHSGKNGGIEDIGLLEDASETVARDVPGFDVVFYGHDHSLRNDTVVNVEGKTVYCMDPASEGRGVGTAEITFTLKGNKVVDKQIKAELKNMHGYRNDARFDAHFANDMKNVLSYINHKIGTFGCELNSRDCFTGSSAFSSFINQMQMEITGAPISITAPLSTSAVIPKGDVTVRDMFNLYRYENYLYTMRLTGREILGELEMSYASWVNQMKRAEDDLLLMQKNNKDDQHIGFQNFYFNFDSASGINYTVDVRKPAGQRGTITTLTDGTPFELDKSYLVAINSYRGNGGGELLIKGAGISRDELAKRIVKSTDHDLRYYLIKYVEEKKQLNPQNDHNWRFIPEEWTVPAGKRDMDLLLKKR